ncbi:MAG TPA: hypothetical protein VFV99_05085 [Kofleriaceae bacterium]|nr:hypothetical protein [Kofleriaceae bacterium]
MNVLDVFGDFNNPATGTRSWRTILTFQTGHGANGASPAAYALDVTDPTAPVVVWEYTKPTSPGVKDFGTGLTVAAGPVLLNGQRTNVVVLETNNGGSGTTGVVWTALSHETGAELWQRGYQYPSPPRGNSADNPLPTTGIPGGAVTADLAGSGYVTDFVFGDLYGNLWLVAASTGLTRAANDESTPLFSFSTNKHPIGAPPAIYSNGSKQFAAFVSGGYADPTANSWAATTQYIIAAKLDTSATSTVTEATTACMQASCALAVNTTLGNVGATGDKGFAQALVVGNQLFITTDSTDVNSSSYGTTSNTGHLTAINLATGTATTAVVINSGGTSLVNSSTTLFSASATKQQQTATSATSTTGTRVDLTTATLLKRALWLRTE